MRDENMLSGWYCPHCGAVNAPWMNQCNCHLLRPTANPIYGTDGEGNKYTTITGKTAVTAPENHPSHVAGRSTESILNMFIERN